MNFERTMIFPIYPIFYLPQEGCTCVYIYIFTHASVASPCMGLGSVPSAIWKRLLYAIQTMGPLGPKYHIGSVEQTLPASNKGMSRITLSAGRPHIPGADKARSFSHFPTPSFRAFCCFRVHVAGPPFSEAMARLS